MTLLVVSATVTEARHVDTRTLGLSGGRLLVTGIGKVAAATAVARDLALHPETDAVVNIGSCGALRDGLSGVFEVGTVVNHDFSADAIRALGHDAEDEIALSRPGVTLATGDLFVTDPDVRARLAERAHLVDMEGYAIAHAARAAGVADVRLVKHVSDNADESARDWAAVADASARALAAWLAERLE